MHRDVTLTTYLIVCYGNSRVCQEPLLATRDILHPRAREPELPLSLLGKITSYTYVLSLPITYLTTCLLWSQRSPYVLLKG